MPLGTPVCNWVQSLKCGENLRRFRDGTMETKLSVENWKRIRVANFCSNGQSGACSENFNDAESETVLSWVTAYGS